jgi:S-DNA-T family DNA segregation ATPase FtsK/SpoIIIE
LTTAQIPDDEGARVYDIATRKAAVEASTGVELVDAETDDLLPVEEGLSVNADDDPRATLYATITSRVDDPRPPIVPAWMLNPDQRREVLRYVVREARYRTLFHLARTVDTYSWRIPAYTVRGTARVVWRTGVWASGVGNGLHGLRQEAASRNEPDVWHKLEQHRIRLSVWRLGVLGACLLLVVLGVLALTFAAPWWAPYLVGVVVTPPLVWVGRTVGKPVLIRTVTAARFTRLTGEMVRNAAVAIRVGVKDPGQIDFPPPGVHRDGPGWLARFNLPPGVEADTVVAKRKALSSALRLPVDQVWPAVSPEHQGQVDLWVGYQPSSKMRPPRWALTSPTARTSFFDPFPFGTDERLRAVSACLFELNFLIGGQPGSGKTYGARALALGAALDPLVELMIAEFKGTADFLDLAPLCSTYICGVDDEAFDEAARMVAWGLAESERRGRRIRAAKERGEAPQGKVTPELAAKPGSGLHPVVMVFDEAHEVFLNRPEVAKDMERLIRRGRALGITVILATQIPDKDSVPPNITRCVTVRWCMSVGDHTANNMILGTGAYARGLDATVYQPKISQEDPGDAGWGVMTGIAAPGSVRSYFPSEDDLRTILVRASRLRGGVVGSGLDEVDRADLLDDVLRVFADTSRPKLQWVEIAELLAGRDPDVYAEITEEAISARCRAAGVPSVDVKRPGERRNLKGCERGEIEAAIDRRMVGSGRS